MRLVSRVYKWNFNSNNWTEIFAYRTPQEAVFHEGIYPVSGQDVLYCLTLLEDLSHERTILKLVPPLKKPYVPGSGSNVFQLYHFAGHYNLYQSSSGLIPFGYKGLFIAL